MICIKNRNCGRISIYKTKETLGLLRILSENKIISYEHVCNKILLKENKLKSKKALKGSDYKLYLNIRANIYFEYTRVDYSYVLLINIYTT